MYYYNGDVYEGEWHQDKRSGRGKYTFSSGQYYEGQWKNDKKNGHGVFNWGNGIYYTGNWVDNERSGKGTNYYEGGDKYVGMWAKDLCLVVLSVRAKSTATFVFGPKKWRRFIGRVAVNSM